MENIRKYNESSYYSNHDIVENLLSIAGIKDDEAEVELEMAIYQLEAMAQNEYNSDCWRVLYNILLKITE